MTIFGVAGATAILFTGFSVQSSISKINERQFSEIIKYDMMVALNDNLEENQVQELKELTMLSEVKLVSSIYYEEVSVTAGQNSNTQEIKVIIPENEEEFRNYINLINRQTDRGLELNYDSAYNGCRIAINCNYIQFN